MSTHHRAIPKAGIPHPASGCQFELHRGNAIARIGQVAAVLREFTVDGCRYTETWPDEDVPPMACGTVLMPWPNRVAGGRWRYGDRDLQLDITNPQIGDAIHGLLMHTAYQPAEVTDRSVSLTSMVYPQHGWPFTLDTLVSYSLTSRGLRVTHTVQNVGAERAVFGCGAHPYLRIGDIPLREMTLTVRARTRAIIDDRRRLVGLEPSAGTEDDLAAGVSLSVPRTDLGVGLTDLIDVGGRFEHVLSVPDGRGVTLWTDHDFGWVQVYTPRHFPAADGPRLAVAIEPMTCGINALNSGRDLIGLRPGESWSASWGLEPMTP